MQGSHAAGAKTQPFKPRAPYYTYMALRLSKRKRPSAEDKQVKQANVIAHKVFDDKTVEVLLHFLNAGVFNSLDYPVASGKESIVFRATTNVGFVAVKVFKYETSAFRNFSEYVQGDPRFKMKNTLRARVHLWARKEFANLSTCARAQVSAPKPIAFRENVVVMEFMGEKGVPFPSLEEVVVDDPEKAYSQVVAEFRKIYLSNLVHADLSAYNILYHKKPVIIDWGQAVLLQHPSAEEFLHRDATNVARFFTRCGLEKTAEDVLAEVKR